MIYGQAHSGSNNCFPEELDHDFTCDDLADVFSDDTLEFSTKDLCMGFVFEDFVVDVDFVLGDVSLL